MTPLHLTILIHYYTSEQPYSGAGYPSSGRDVAIQQENELIEAELLKLHRDTAFSTICTKIAKLGHTFIRTTLTDGSFFMEKDT